MGSRMLKAAGVLAVLMNVGGCEFHALMLATPEELRAIEDDDKIIRAHQQSLGMGGDDTLLDEVARRRGWSDEDREDIRKGTVRQGFTKWQLFAARGYTPPYVSVSALGRSETYDYGSTTFYVRDGKVTGWSSWR